MSLNYCSLASGSSGNAHFIATESTKILIDVGLSAKYIATSLEKIGESAQDLDGILVTHEHSDHIKGLPVMMRKFAPRVFLNQATYDTIKDKLENTNHDLITIIDEKELVIGDLTIQPFSVYHDAVDPYGYAISHQGKKLSILTDVGIIDQPIMEAISQSSFLVIEANHDINMVNFGPYPYPLKRRILGREGHLSNERAGQVIGEIFRQGQLKTAILAHLSKDNNFPELAYLTVQNVLEEQGIIIDEDIHVELTYRDKIGKYYRIL